MTTKATSSGPPSASVAHPAATPASPAVIERGAASEPAITARLKGAKTRPFVVSASSSARSMAGLVVPVSAAATRPPRTSGRVSAARGTTGRRVERASRARPASSGSSIVSLRPSRTAARPSVSAAAPSTSMGARSPRLSGSNRPASAAPASPTGTLTANTHSHPSTLVMTPPSTQPDAPPPAAAAVQIPSARCRSGAVATRSASAEGAISADPAPWTARAAISAAAVGASAHASEATAKRSRPIWNTRRRP